MKIDKIIPPALPNKFASDADVLAHLVAAYGPTPAQRQEMQTRAQVWVHSLRADTGPGLMESFLAEYSLSTREGVSLMRLAEAMLRVPDAVTKDALIQDKINGQDWAKHSGQASSRLVNTATGGLQLTSAMLGAVGRGDDAGLGAFKTNGLFVQVLDKLVRPAMRTGSTAALTWLGGQFVLGQDISKALAKSLAKSQANSKAKSHTSRDGNSHGGNNLRYSFDMLGEAAMTAQDAARYAASYADAIATIGTQAASTNAHDNPSISIKLSALHPRFETAHRVRVLAQLVPIVTDLAIQAKTANIGLTVDAEEQNRVDLTLDVVRQVAAASALSGWQGLGVVVQAYGKRALHILDALHDLAETHDTRINVRLVKGAYWDTEIKHAQVEGHAGFPVFVTKAATDMSYTCLVSALFARSDRLFPQFATHNALSIAAVDVLADGQAYELQRLHGMGEALHTLVQVDLAQPCRIYAPVGPHRDLLAYLVRRLLENGANSSFVHQVLDPALSVEHIVADPFGSLDMCTRQDTKVGNITMPCDLFAPSRQNARGWDLSDRATLNDCAVIQAEKVIAGAGQAGSQLEIYNPATGALVGAIATHSVQDVQCMIAAAVPWQASPGERARVLNQAADMLEHHSADLFDLLAREAGKTASDRVGEVREAVDFLRFYASECLGAGGQNQGQDQDQAPLGLVAAISPWNFPLAIFLGQVTAALAAGNAVIAKPAEQTPLIAARAVDILHSAGVPTSALQLAIGTGTAIGAAITANPGVNGVVFTGSTATAQVINRTMAQHLAPGAPLVAETGGLNVMIVDSTALLEQAVKDIITSAFRSAGQRCSALRCLYVQSDIAPALIAMIKGAMDQLVVGDPSDPACDVGPLIDAKALAGIQSYLSQVQADIIHQTGMHGNTGDNTSTNTSTSTHAGHFVPPTLIRVDGIASLTREIFGPVLHVATFEIDTLDQVMDAINASGYGLTFGLHTRLNSRVARVTQKLSVGNAYVNRNQIGAVVGSQPFGGEGLSGTGPKAGGPEYVRRFYAPQPMCAPSQVQPARSWTQEIDVKALTSELALVATPAPASTSASGWSVELPGPTGELNQLYTLTRSPVLCLGPGPDAERIQADCVTRLGGVAVQVKGMVEPEQLAALDGFSAAIWWGHTQPHSTTARALAVALAARPGAITPLITHMPLASQVTKQRHVCIDTTAEGGNASLLSG